MKRIMIMVTAGAILSLSYINANPVYPLKNKRVAGIFMKEKDFEENALNFRAAGKDIVRLHQFFFQADIRYKTNSTKIDIPKDSIFAIQLQDGEKYRFFNRRPYKMEDAGRIFVYSLETSPYEYKISGPHRRIMHSNIMKYFFWVPDQKELYSLTRDNIERHLLRRASDISAFRKQFTSEWQLTNQDKITGNLLINDFLETL